jgi:hypothetical protein
LRDQLDDYRLNRKIRGLIGLSGFIAEAVGYIPLFIIAIVIGLASTVLVIKTFDRTQQLELI